MELNVEVMLKATKVDGIYDKDPKKFPDAVKFSTLDYQKAIVDNLQVMDTTAMVMCRDNKIPMMVFNMTKSGEIVKAVFEDGVGTLVS